MFDFLEAFESCEAERCEALDPERTDDLEFSRDLFESFDLEDFLELFDLLEATDSLDLDRRLLDLSDCTESAEASLEPGDFDRE